MLISRPPSWQEFPEPGWWLDISPQGSLGTVWWAFRAKWLSREGGRLKLHAHMGLGMYKMIVATFAIATRLSNVWSWYNCGSIGKSCKG